MVGQIVFGHPWKWQMNLAIAASSAYSITSLKRWNKYFHTEPWNVTASEDMLKYNVAVIMLVY